MIPCAQTSDTELVTMLNMGDRAAFECIYRRYASPLIRYVRKNISDIEECHEIIQDIFESLWARHDAVQIESLKAYLHNMARYRMIRYFRRAHLLRKYAEHYKIFETTYDSLPEEQHDPDAIRKLIIKALDGLADRCSTAFKLRVNENLSNGEIAERMNISKGTVELYMVKAFNHLRANLNLEETR